MASLLPVLFIDENKVMKEFKLRQENKDWKEVECEEDSNFLQLGHESEDDL
jgi:hypothetical protein